jgi:hypothetical protein
MKMKIHERKPEKRKIIIRAKPEPREKPGDEALTRLRKAAEEKGWMKKR